MLIPDEELNTVTGKIIAAAIAVHRVLGPGLLESTYAACLRVELQKAQLRHDRQVRLPIVYDGVVLEVGYRLDLIVERLVIVEVKALNALAPVHRAQLLTYLKLGNYPAGLLINFNVPGPEGRGSAVLNAAAPRRVVARAE